MGGWLSCPARLGGSGGGGSGRDSGPAAAARGKDLGVEPFARHSLPIKAAAPKGDGDTRDASLEAAAPPAGSAEVVLSRGSVVAFRGDAIVNAANVGCLGGAGVDGAINAAGGEALLGARHALPVLDQRGTRCATGDAKVTIGGDLPAKWCVHAVGPDYWQVEHQGEPLEAGDALLRSAYLAAMARAQEVGAEVVGFSLLSAGVFRGRRSLEEVLTVAVAAVESGAYPGLREVHLVAFTPAEVEALERAARRVWSAREGR